MLQRAISPLVLAVLLAAAVSAPASADVPEDWTELEFGVLDLELVAAWITDVLPTMPVARICPVDGPHHFTDTWGEARAWGREHKGTDIDAERGTPLVAVERGVIVQRGWHWAGGFGVYLLGSISGDVYYYAHLDWIHPSVRPGVWVDAGEVLGWVGFTGNAESAHLHFGWIPDHGPGWVDLDGLANPYELLRNICGA